jgi:outer membrane protein
MKKLICFFVILSVLWSGQLLAKDSSQVVVAGPWSLIKSVEYALSNNPDSQMAKTRISHAQAKLQEANSSLYPRINLHGTYDQTDNPMYSFGNILNQGEFDQNINFNDPGRTDNLKLKAELLYNIYNGGRDRATISSSEFHRDGLISEHTSILNQLAFEVVRSFHQIVQAGEMVEARKSAMAAIGASLQVGKARHEAGTLLRQDLLNLEVQEAGASENLIQARHALILTHHAFNNLLGIVKGPVEIITNPVTDQEIPQLLDYSGRPELKAIEDRLASARAELDAASAGMLPTIDGFASYQYEHGFINDGSGDSWMAGVRLSYSLYEGQATRSKIAAKEAQVLELQALKRKIELALNLELQQAEQVLQQANERMVVTEKMVQLAKESGRLSRARFKEGVILSSDLIDVETRLTDALVRNAQAKALYKTSIANLRKTVGLKQF